MSEQTVEPMVGHCHCGSIRYEAQPPIVKSSYCDCPGCQRATGTFKAPFVTVYQKGLSVISGEPSSFRADSGVMCDAHGAWYFCSKCGTQVFWKPDRGDELDIFAGTLEDTNLFQPEK
jgi:hypothetical protein